MVGIMCCPFTNLIRLYSNQTGTHGLSKSERVGRGSIPAFEVVYRELWGQGLFPWNSTQSELVMQPCCIRKQ